MFQLKIAFFIIKALLHSKFKDKTQLRHWQQKQIKKHLSWLHRHSPFYKQLKNIPFEALPILNKATMMAHFDTLNTRQIRLVDAMTVATKAETSRDFNLSLGDVTVGLSSGTSGNKGLFLATENERAKWVAEILLRVLPIRFGHRQKIAFFLRADSKLYQSIRSRAFAFHFFDLAQPLPALLARLADLKPHILIAPPSVLLEVAQLIENQKITLAPTKIISVAEVLEPDMAQRLSRIFNKTIHQVYQATEGFLASTCSHGKLHFHEDLLLIEKKYVDEACTVFHPIITDFSRQTQPIVRYELNDLIHERMEQCPCGSIFMGIDHIEGRSDDVLEFGDTKIFPDFFRYAILLASDAIENFQLIQITDCELIIKLKTQKDFDVVAAKVTQNVQALLAKHNVTNVHIAVSTLNEQDFFNKFRRIKKTL